jgi:hypothetical protein
VRPKIEVGKLVVIYSSYIMVNLSLNGIISD